jgi:PIN domain nuclease of toxin-antitoxin system
LRTTVFDASALLALFFDEPGAEKVNQAAEADKPIYIAAVNWAEVLYRMHRKHGDAGVETAKHFERTMPLEVAPLDRELAETAADLKVKHGLGLADAFAASLAMHKKAELVAGDKEFKAVETAIKINWLK